jgi:hypothetical protein
MIMAIYAILLPSCSFIMCVFGFFAGRCARKIPILDNHLPRALHRGQGRLCDICRGRPRTWRLDQSLYSGDPDSPWLTRTNNLSSSNLPCFALTRNDRQASVEYPSAAPPGFFESRTKT